MTHIHAPISTYQSARDFLRHLKRPRAPGANDRSEAHHPTWEWDHDVGYAGAIRLATVGDPEGAAVVRELMNQFRALLDDPKQDQLAPSVIGPYLDVGLYAAGDPECFYQPAPLPVREAYRIGLNLSASFDIDASVLHMRGAAVAAVATILSERGVPVEVWVGWTGTRGTHRGCPDTQRTLIRIQEAGQAIDADAFAFWCAHPAVPRRLAFRDLEVSDDPRIVAMTREGYGLPTAGGTVKEDAGLDLWIPFTPSMHGWTSPAAALPWVRKQLEQAGLAGAPA